MSELDNKENSILRVALELGVAVGLLLVPLPVPAEIPLLLLAMLALGLRGQSFADVGLDGTKGLPTAVGGIAVGIAVATTLYFSVGPSPGSDYLGVEGNARQLIAILMISAAMAMVSEMVFRGYLIHRMKQAWGETGVAVGVLSGALLSALATQPDTMTEGLGVVIFSIGYALLYLASKHKLLLPFAVHFAIDGHGAVIEYLGL